MGIAQTEDKHIMNMRVIICGGRDFADKKLCFDSLGRLLSEYEAMEIVSGHARGADLFGEEYARIHGLKLTVFKADWKKYGRGAGPVRNRQMLEYALKGTAVIIAFWDGKSKGTKNMIDQARKAGAEVKIVRYPEKHVDTVDNDSFHEA